MENFDKPEDKPEEELKDSIQEDLIGKLHARSDSLIEYALRRAWAESKNIIDKI